MSLCVKLSSRRSSARPPQTNNFSDEAITDLSLTHTHILLTDCRVCGLNSRINYFFISDNKSQFDMFQCPCVPCCYKGKITFLNGFRIIGWWKYMILLRDFNLPCKNKLACNHLDAFPLKRFGLYCPKGASKVENN